MKYLAFVTLLLTYTLGSCATMSAEEKSRWLREYRKITAKTVQRDFDAPHGIKDQFVKRIKFMGRNLDSKKTIAKLVFTKNTGHGIDTLMKMLIDADVRAMNEIYTGEEVRYWVEFFNSYEGKQLLKKQDQLDRELDAEIAANPGIDPESITERQNKQMEEAAEDIADNFQAGVGSAIVRKMDEYLGRAYRYEQEARSLYDKKLKAAIIAHYKKKKRSRSRKTKPTQ